MHKRIKNPYVHYSIMVFMYLIGAVTLLSHTLLHSFAMADQASSCRTVGATIVITISDHAFMPNTVHANTCDALYILNTGQHAHELALGQHEHHSHYPGFAEATVTNGESYSFLLQKSGTLLMHDHLDEDLHANIIIK